MARFEVIGFDADDTLWHSEDSFHRAEQRFVEMLQPYVAEGIDLNGALRATERRHLPISGYGVKAWTLSMVECAVNTSLGKVPAAVIGELVELGMDMLIEPVRVIDGVPEVLADLGRDHRLVMITKGDLIHQWRKVEMSGLAHHFSQIEVVMEKDPEVYGRILREISVDPEHFCMVGNSVRSDVLPVLALGSAAVHVEYPFTWEFEVVDHEESVVSAESISAVPALIRAAGHVGSDMPG